MIAAVIPNTEQFDRSALSRAYDRLNKCCDEQQLELIEMKRQLDNAVVFARQRQDEILSLKEQLTECREDLRQATEYKRKHVELERMARDLLDDACADAINKQPGDSFTIVGECGGMPFLVGRIVGRGLEIETTEIRYLAKVL